jgi:hypothetical protein
MVYCLSRQQSLTDLIFRIISSVAPVRFSGELASSPSAWRNRCEPIQGVSTEILVRKKGRVLALPALFHFQRTWEPSEASGSTR